MVDDKIVLSGIQPTGYVQLGNLLGAVDVWVEIQSRYKRKFFFMADLHSLDGGTLGLADASVEMACTYIACGIDPNDCRIFVQSHIPQHAELCWLLGCITPMGLLNRMTQFKDKSNRAGVTPMLSLYSYPVLMVADILLYNAEVVPVGDDQTQHVELARDVVLRFNQRYGEYFKLPMILKKKEATRIMSLTDPTKKMSKSDPSDFSRINLSDPKELIEKKILSAKTDSILGFSPEGLQERPEASNLLNIAACLSGKKVEQLCSEVSNFSELKSMLIDLLLAKLLPIQEKRKNLERDAVKRMLADSAEAMREIARANLIRIKQLMQLI
ncbi:tryptophan--tRNA ligase [Neorickettsia sp. 179522]|uniref:tryptophan--tRNA ligase n=1 Tax=Neorickettsia sp. 179522 TaxID=1714371 RepID=UPI0009EEFAD3|nr:tryptophan--tRNA ligase [Neorickettsia sp. 179522]